MKCIVITGKSLYKFALSTLCCLTALACGVHAAAIYKASGRCAPVYRVETTEKVVAISFDAMWGKDDTLLLLDILNQYHVKATFFVMGKWAERYPSSVSALAEAGHEIGNHTDSHPHMQRLREERMDAELLACNLKIREAGGEAPLLYRPPYGDVDGLSLAAARKQNLQPVLWDVDSLDWKNLSPRKIYLRVITQTNPGSILRFHNGAINTPAALPDILEKLQAEGYQIVTISELIDRGK